MAVDSDGSLFLKSSFEDLLVVKDSDEFVDASPSKADAIATGTDGRVYAIDENFVRPVSSTDDISEPLVLTGLTGTPVDLVVDGDDIYVLECLVDVEQNETTGSRIMMFPNGSREAVELLVAGLGKAVRMTLHAGRLYIASGDRVLTHPLG